MGPTFNFHRRESRQSHQLSFNGTGAGSRLPVNLFRAFARASTGTGHCANMFATHPSYSASPTSPRKGIQLHQQIFRQWTRTIHDGSHPLKHDRAGSKNSKIVSLVDKVGLREKSDPRLVHGAALASCTMASASGCHLFVEPSHTAFASQDGRCHPVRTWQLSAPYIVHGPIEETILGWMCIGQCTTEEGMVYDLWDGCQIWVPPNTGRSPSQRSVRWTHFRAV